MSVLVACHPRLRRLVRVMSDPAASAAEKVAAQNEYVRRHRQLVRFGRLLVGLGVLVFLGRACHG